ncbi:aldehyde dehydrogenase (NADP(+)) [Polymorphospora rubra]|nr:aldehyde dehydrogenase (NADP(+)) [Polymorphospora rubra]
MVVTTERTAMPDVDRTVRAADDAFEAWERHGRTGRADVLDAIAERLEAARADLVPVAERETGLATARLEGEVGRAAFQFRLFGTVLREGSYVEATIDPAGDTPLGRRPDLRRMLIPLGPVGVFGASNFPFAFSVAGGDTASALAAGCPVVVKAHPSHPETSRRSYEVIRAAVESAGLPAGVIGLVEGYQAGVDLVNHPDITAVGFTGSIAGGRALADLAAARPRPIPFYGELGSLNPLVVSPGAAAADPAGIATGYVNSVTGSLGQLCTKPGLLFVPVGPDGDKLRAALAEAVAATAPGRPLNSAIKDAYVRETGRRRDDARLALLGEGTPAGPDQASPALFTVAAADLTGDLLEECFGPTALVIGYEGTDDLLDALRRLDGQLTATLHVTADETALRDRLHDVVRRRAGRLLFGGFPTGLAVAWGTHHGGPYPSTTLSGHTSVGATAIRRWLRPVSYQDAPADILPAELRDGNPTGIPRRIDGTLTT